MWLTQDTPAIIFKHLLQFLYSTSQLEKVSSFILDLHFHEEAWAFSSHQVLSTELEISIPESENKLGSFDRSLRFKRRKNSSSLYP